MDDSVCVHDDIIQENVSVKKHHACSENCQKICVQMFFVVFKKKIRFFFSFRKVPEALVDKVLILEEEATGRTLTCYAERFAVVDGNRYLAAFPKVGCESVDDTRGWGGAVVSYSWFAVP